MGRRWVRPATQWTPIGEPFAKIKTPARDGTEQEQKSQHAHDMTQRGTEFQYRKPSNVYPHANTKPIAHPLQMPMPMPMPMPMRMPMPMPMPMRMPMRIATTRVPLTAPVPTPTTLVPNSFGFPRADCLTGVSS